MALHQLLTRITATAVAAAVFGVVIVGPAVADDATTPAATPSAQPTTSDEARTAWITAARGIEELSQSVLLAQQQVAAQQAAAADAQRAVDATLADVQAAAARVATADAQVAVFKPRLDAFANASLKGARLGSLSSLLTAGSASDYLDKVTALDQVAGETLNTMAAAKRAKADALAAKAAADAVRTTAQRAADQAAAAVVTAQRAADDLRARQSEMQTTIVTYEKLYTSLSLTERGAAVENFENANVSPEALVRLNAEADARAAAGITDETLSAIAVKLAPDTPAAIAVAAALTRRGLPYVWGAVGPQSFDCSGLMLWAWKQAGIDIPRTSAVQAGLPAVPLDQLQPGDLVTYYSPVTHVGMYIGNGLVMHASMPGVPLKVVPLEKAGPNATGHRVPR